VKAIGLSKETVSDFRTFPVDAHLPLSDAIRERRPMFLENRQAIVDRYPTLREANARAVTSAWAMTPLMVGQRVVGGIAWGYYEERKFTETERQFIDVLARQCALAVERAQLYAAERAAREAAQAANRAKSDFLATMSHELRTPINAIQGYAQLLDLGIPGPVTETQREYLSRLGASAEHLLGLVNEVLDLAKIESGTISVQRESVLSGDTVDAALSLIRPQAASKELALSERCEGARSTPYVGDEHRVRQILTNLLSNAVKFTEPHGRIIVDCTIAQNPPPEVADNRDGPFVVFRVADTGSGIAKDQIERIFDPFTQADTVQKNPYTRGWSGTGLGLTISRRLARLMGGELTVDSSPGVGSEFRLWMPMLERRLVPRVNASKGPVPQAAPVAKTPFPDAVVETASAAPIPGLALIADELIKETHNIVREFVDRVRASEQTPRHATDSQIEDHMATFLADSAIGLRLLEVAGGDPSDLLRDSSAIMRTIMEQHGNQRFRLAWSEDAITTEMGILRDVACETIRRISGDDKERGERACEAVSQFIGQARRQAIAAYRFSAATLQLGAMT
jgi:signal transduction histidine kinase